MNITIKFDMDNAAFEDAPMSEVCRILRDLSDHLEQGIWSAPFSTKLCDLNGLACGEVHIWND
jgi:hypothetical protein